MPTYTNCTINRVDFRTTSFGRQVELTGTNVTRPPHRSETHWVRVPSTVEMPLILAKFHNRRVNMIATTGSGTSQTVYQVIIL